MNQDAYDVRLAREDEGQQLAELYQHLHLEDEPKVATDLILATWSKLRRTPGLHVVVAQQNSDLVASCILCIVPNLTRGCRSFALIENVVTHSDYRNRGIGRSIMEYALNIAWSHQCYKVMLLTGRKEPEVHRFYERCGFKAGEKEGYIARPPQS